MGGIGAYLGGQSQADAQMAAIQAQGKIGPEDIEKALAFWKDQEAITENLYGAGLERLRGAREDVKAGAARASALIGASSRELAKASVRSGERADAAVKEAGMSRGLGGSSATARARISAGAESSAQTAGIRAGALGSLAQVQQQRGTALAGINQGIAGYFAQQEQARRGITAGQSIVQTTPRVGPEQPPWWATQQAGGAPGGTAYSQYRRSMYGRPVQPPQAGA